MWLDVLYFMGCDQPFDLLKGWPQASSRAQEVANRMPSLLIAKNAVKGTLSLATQALYCFLAHKIIFYLLQKAQ